MIKQGTPRAVRLTDDLESTRWRSIFSRREAGSRARSTTKRDGQPRCIGWPTNEVTRSARTGERTPGRARVIEPTRDVQGTGRKLRSSYTAQPPAVVEAQRKQAAVHMAWRRVVMEDEVRDATRFWNDLEVSGIATMKSVFFNQTMVSNL